MRWKFFRWICAGLSLGAAVHFMRIGLKQTGISGAGPVILSMGAFVTAVLLIVPETVFRMAEWFGSWVAELFFPSERLKKPPLSYHMARHYRQCGRLEESLSHCEAIVEHYPEEREAYLELLAVTRALGDGRRESRYRAMYQKRFGHSIDEAPQGEASVASQRVD